MADLPKVPDYSNADSPLTPVPTSPRTRQTTSSRRRKSSRPAPTIYLTGFSCIASDLEYEHARDVTGNVQPYWFKEAYTSAEFYQGVERRARKNMTLLENEVAAMDIHGTRSQMNRAAARNRRERVRERAFVGEMMWSAERDESWFDDTDNRLANLSHGMGRMVTEEEEWKKRRKFEDGKRKKKEREEEARQASHTSIEHHEFSLLEDQNNATQKKIRQAGVVERQSVAAQEDEEQYKPEHHENVLHLPLSPPHDTAMEPSSITTFTTTDSDVQAGNSTLMLRPRSPLTPQMQAIVELQQNPDDSA